MAKLSNKDKIWLAETWHLEQIKSQLNAAKQLLDEAQEGYCILNSCDGDRTKVKKAPILQAVEANVSVGMALTLLEEMERMFKDD